MPGFESDLVGAQIGDFTIQEEIAQGAFGAVWSCVHRPTENIAAVKVMRKDEMDAIDHEAMLEKETYCLARCEHPFVCGYYSQFEDQERRFLFMENCVGGSLSDQLRQCGRLGLSELRMVMSQVVVAVDFLHMRGYMHRDLKLDNVLLDANGNTRLVDFGLACDIDKPATQKCGSVGYLAPEIVRGEAYGREVDVWSLGVMGFTLATGNHPFGEVTEAQAVQKIAFEELEWPPMDEDLSDLLRRMMQRDPRDRITLSEARQHVFLAATVRRIESWLTTEFGPAFDRWVSEEVARVSPPPEGSSSGVICVLAQGSAGVDEWPEGRSGSGTSGEDSMDVIKRVIRRRRIIDTMEVLACDDSGVRRLSTVDISSSMRVSSAREMGLVPGMGLPSPARRRRQSCTVVEQSRERPLVKMVTPRSRPRAVMK